MALEHPGWQQHIKEKIAAAIDAQFDAVFQDIEVAAAKSGMLASVRVIEAVERAGGQALLNTAWEGPERLPSLAEIREQDIRTIDFSPATVVTMYLYPGANLRLRPELMRQLRPGSRVVSHQFAMGNWQPERVERVKDSSGLTRTIYLWRIADPIGR